ncbi:hypothetical protein AAVH_29213 [Aphelenchoides avenae]|nr:hypothetical protein AAVH_29213 [Aphelenchus avenae]
MIAVEAHEKGLEEPCLYPYGVACTAHSSTCRGSRNLYSRENFQKHNHTLGGVKATKKELEKKPTPEQKRILELVESYEPTGSTSLVYSRAIKECPTHGTWADVAQTLVQNRFVSFEHLCVPKDGQAKHWIGKCEEPMHLGQLVEGSRSANDDAWTSFFDIATVIRDPDQDELAKYLAAHNIVWTEPTDDSFVAATQRAKDYVADNQPSTSTGARGARGGSHR